MILISARAPLTLINFATRMEFAALISLPPPAYGVASRIQSGEAWSPSADGGALAPDTKIKSGRRHNWTADVSTNVLKEFFASAGEQIKGFRRDMDHGPIIVFLGGI